MGCSTNIRSLEQHFFKWNSIIQKKNGIHKGHKDSFVQWDFVFVLFINVYVSMGHNGKYIFTGCDEQISMSYGQRRFLSLKAVINM